mmetsp:Transcript_38666/g.124258  ORF Transcript_38666/g.124258 Transcript_38666/m.124258 type:complete len:343 (+) Transcript_38666:1401-2429(+)
MRRVRRIEGRGLREALVAGPKGTLVLLRVGVDDARVLREGIDKILNLVAEEQVEVIESHLTCALDGRRRSGAQQREQAPHLEDGLRVVGAGLAVIDEGVGVLSELLGLLAGLHEEQLELVARPLDAMVGQVGEVPQGAHRDAASLVGLTAVPVRLRLHRHDGVHVARGAHGAALQQRLLVLHTLVVDVEARLHVIQGIADAIEAHPEIIVELVLGLGTDEHLQSLHLHARVHDLRHARGGSALRLADVVLAEQELPRQVRELDAVRICDGQEAILTTADAIECVVLEELAAESSTSHHEVPQVRQLLDEAMAIHRGEVVVAAALRGAIRRKVVRESLDGIHM